MTSRSRQAAYSNDTGHFVLIASIQRTSLFLSVYYRRNAHGTPIKAATIVWKEPGNWLFIPILFWFMRSISQWGKEYILRVLHTAQKWP